MKIGMVCYPTQGGSGVVATELGHQLALRGHDVHFMAYEPPFRLDLERERVFFHEVGTGEYEQFQYPSYALTLAAKIAEVAKRESLDILHVHYAIPHAISAYLAKQLLKTSKPAVITTLHGTDITLVGHDPAFASIVEFSLENSDGVTAVSQNLRAKTLQDFSISKPIEVIYNFVQPIPELVGKKPKWKALSCTNGRTKEKVLLHGSNFRSVKRVKDVVAVFAKVQKTLPAKLVFLGTGLGLDEVRSYIEELGLYEHVLFLGQQQYVDEYLASADLFILPSAEESFGLAALESMAYGVPVIATDVGGLPEVVEHGESGFLSPVGAVDQMAQYAVQLLTDEPLYKRFSERGIEIAKEKFSCSKIIPLYEALYAKHTPLS